MEENKYYLVIEDGFEGIQEIHYISADKDKADSYLDEFKEKYEANRKNIIDNFGHLIDKYGHIKEEAFDNELIPYKNIRLFSFWIDSLKVIEHKN